MDKILAKNIQKPWLCIFSKTTTVYVVHTLEMSTILLFYIKYQLHIYRVD
jgi:hypothetical protein